jgi:Cu-Zn family superoxide dismutase
MRKIGLSIGIVCLAAACGGSSKKTATPRNEPPAAVNESIPAEEQPTMVVAGTGQEPAAPEAAPPAEAMKPALPVAIADVKATKDDAVMGAVTFEQGDDGMITISGQFTGLKPGKHAIYIHDQGDCSAKGRKVGLHLNPTKAKHGPPSSGMRHAGDFGNIEADDSGTATFNMKTDSITMVADRPDSVLNRSIVIHANADDKKGSGGAPVACGVIALKEATE